jgi:hypothetical protein
MSPRTIFSGDAICQPGGYLPLFSEFGVVEVAAPVEAGVEALVDDDVDDGEVPEAADELVSEDDGLLDDGLLDALDDVDGGVLGAIDELDDVELGGGVVVLDDDEVDGDGVTTGGVVLVVVDVSRLQPATPSTRPAQSSVTNARFICVLQMG